MTTSSTVRPYLALNSKIQALVPENLKNQDIQVESAFLVNIHEDEVKSESTSAIAADFEGVGVVLILFNKNGCTPEQAIEKVSAHIFNDTDFRLAETIDASNLQPLEPKDMK